MVRKHGAGKDMFLQKGWNWEEAGKIFIMGTWWFALLADIVRFIESKRLRWVGHLARVGKTEKLLWIFFLAGKPERKRLIWRPTCVRQHNIKINLLKKSGRTVSIGHVFHFTNYMHSFICYMLPMLCFSYKFRWCPPIVRNNLRVPY
jgi:purine-cytosine permease-like protein